MKPDEELTGIPALIERMSGRRPKSVTVDGRELVQASDDSARTPLDHDENRIEHIMGAVRESHPVVDVPTGHDGIQACLEAGEYLENVIDTILEADAAYMAAVRASEDVGASPIPEGERASAQGTNTGRISQHAPVPASSDGKTDDARIVYFEFEDMGTAEAFMEAVSDWLCEEVECPLALRALAIEKKLHGMGTLCPRYWLYNDASASMGPASDLRSVHESTAEPQSEFARRHQRDKALLAAEDDAGADLPEALRVAELAMDQALSTARWMQDNVPGTNLKSDTLILERGLVLVRQARRGVSSATPAPSSVCQLCGQWIGQTCRCEVPVPFERHEA